MFSYIKGTIEEKYRDYFVLDVNGIGFKIYTSASTMRSLPSKGENSKIFVSLYVREDTLALYGFFTQEELGMFELLISVSGVGPKAAIGAISAISPSKFGLAVITGDIRTLTSIQGIGNKTAQRIILELKDKMKNRDISMTDDEKIKDYPEQHFAEAVSALMVLGYTAVEAKKAVTKVVGDNRDVESIIREALKNLVKK